jgi:hypothetical protein
MTKPKSKLKRMAEAGNPWAIATLAKKQAEARAAGLRGAAMQRAKGDAVHAKRRDRARRESDSFGERTERDRDP